MDAYKKLKESKVIEEPNSGDFRRIDLYFYASRKDKAKLEKLAKAYSDYDSFLSWAESANKWFLGLSKEFDVSKQDIDQLDESFIPVGKFYGVEYDGWGMPTSIGEDAHKTRSRIPAKPKNIYAQLLKSVGSAVKSIGRDLLTFFRVGHKKNIK